MKTPVNQINTSLNFSLKKYEFDQCKGCTQIRSACGMITTVNHEVCPCIKCLVKTTCVWHCQEYQDIFRTAIGCTLTLGEFYPSKKWNGTL